MCEEFEITVWLMWRMDYPMEMRVMVWKVDRYMKVWTGCG